MEQPKIEPRHGVVVAGIAQIQKSQKLLVNEKEPKKSMVLAGTAVQSESEVRRVS
jgi:hypothetical protein